MRSALMVVLLLLSGCAQIEDEGSSPSLDKMEGSKPSESTSTGGIPEGCEPEVSPNGDGYTVWCAVTYDVAATKERGTVSTANGNIAMAKGAANEAEVTYWANGDTEQEAMDRLATMSFEGSTTKLHAVVKASSWGNRGAHIDLSLIAPAEMSVEAGTTNGDIAAQDFTNGWLSLETTNGQIDAKAQRTTVLASTTNGEITVSGSVGALNLETTNGGITAAATPTAFANWDFATTNGEIELEVPEGPDFGYAIEASTTNGAITFAMDEIEDDGPQSPKDRKVKSTDMESRMIRVDVTMDTTNGSITVTGT